jgi:organic radical activating enzyme
MTVSNTLCRAKWAEGTIWLYQGTTASCHHNPFHKIELDTADPSSIYNTPQKFKERTLMVEGGRPEGCSYCWTAEDRGQVSDRTIKSSTLKFVDYKKLSALPQVLEIAFERTCNLACAYCSPSFSSKWSNEIKKNGPYVLSTDSRYQEASILPEDNPYVDAFFSWWPELKTSVDTLRITGGEPLMSPNFWKFLDVLDGFKGTLIINSNLICHKDEIERLLEKTQDITLRIHTSIESNFKQAEYVRDGFEEQVWFDNVTKILSTKRIIVNLSTAINNLSVWSFDEYLKIALKLKSRFGNKMVETSCNFVQYPKFMHIGLIPQFYQQSIAERISKPYSPFKPMFSEVEQQHIERLINLLSNPPLADADATVLKDLKSFIVQYDQRRNKNYKENLDKGFIEWYDSI